MHETSPIFAPSLEYFSSGYSIRPLPDWGIATTWLPLPPTMAVSERVLEVDVLIAPVLDIQNLCLAFLHCGTVHDPISRVAILLRNSGNSGYFVRTRKKGYVAAPGSIPQNSAYLRTLDLGDPRKVQLGPVRRQKIRLLDTTLDDGDIISCTSLPRIGRIVDGDHEKCRVEHIYPAPGTVQTCHLRDYGIVFLCKPGYPRLRVLWYRDRVEEIPANEYKVHLSIYHGSSLKAQEEANAIINVGRLFVGRSQSSHSIIVPSPFSSKYRKITVMMGKRTFLELTVPELTVKVEPLPGELPDIPTFD